MRSRSILAAFLLALLLLPIFQVSGGWCAEDIEVTEVADGLYFLTGVVGNVAFLVTDEGVIVVDSGMRPSHGESILREIRKVTDRPVKYLVLTHYHWDHTIGACTFPGETEVVSHENLPVNIRRFNEPRLKDLLENIYPQRIRERRDDLDSQSGSGEEEIAEAEKALKEAEAELEEARRISLVYPVRTFADSMTIILGGSEIRLTYPGPAHTDGNSIVLFVSQRAAHMGDLLFNRRHPYIDWKAGCDTANWITALDMAAALDIDIVMPGHGGLTDKEGLIWMAEYLKHLRSEVAAAVEAGLTLDETRASVRMEKYADMPWDYMLQAGIEAVYNEMSGAAR